MSKLGKGICKSCGHEFQKRSYNHTFCDICRNKKDGVNKRFQFNRWLLFFRDDFRCVYCGRSSIEDGVKLCVEHVKKEYTVENNKLDRLVTSCTSCNCQKWGKTLSPEIIERIRVRNIELTKDLPDRQVEKMEQGFARYYNEERKRIFRERRNWKK